jgi:ABC-2 type transport system ATP-binding protein
VIGRPVDSLSGGQRRRLEIARALVSEPRVLFLDEPTVGLDTRIRYELLDLISGLRGATGMTTVLTTHYLDEAERLCDRIASCTRARSWPWTGRPGCSPGWVPNWSSCGSNTTRPGPWRRCAPTAWPPATRSRSARPSPSRPGPPARDTIAALPGLGIHAEAVTTRKPTLDDVYLQLTGSRLAA